MVQASDPDILSDFIPPSSNPNGVDGNFFTFTGLRGIFNQAPTTFKDTKVSNAEFPALNGQSVSLAILQFPAGGVNPPLTHPRATGLLFVVGGSLEGLVHYQYNANANANEPATAIAAFGSANPGTALLPITLFASGVDDEILAKSFKTDVATIQKLKAGLAPPKA
ncbi:unnamed protein product [Ilex paraguariensis]|uniref:Cupin type-1 domain-containing protein n=1 Tax=Ilex paraguariensis TaxID=185542 RepID=A0ABC8U8H3_9AQUA